MLVATVAAASCGKKGPPRPPEPRGPLQPGNVEARQVGPDVVVHFTAPRPRGPKPAQRPAQVEVIRLEFPPDAQAPADPDAFRRRGVLVDVRDLSAVAPGTRFRLVDPTLERLPSRGVGWTLRYGVRVLDEGGRPSPLVVARDLVPLDPLAPPTDLVAEATADGIRLEWNAAPGADAIRYNLYRARAGEAFGEAPVNPAPLAAAEYLDDRVVDGEAYAYLVRGTLSAEAPPRESASSEIVQVLAEDRFPPASPKGLVAVQEGRAVRLFWSPGPEPDLEGYRLYRRRPGEAWERVGPDPIPQPLFLDAEVEIGERLQYRVSAIDRASPPNESGPSDVVAVDLAEEPPRERSESP